MDRVNKVQKYTDFVYPNTFLPMIKLPFTTDQILDYSVIELILVKSEMTILAQLSVKGQNLRVF